MKTLMKNSRIELVIAAMLAVLMISFSPLIQAAQSAAPFDHSKTGFLLKDVHLTLRCEQCHVDGIFKNTPKDCAGCHTLGTRVAAKPKPINHVPTKNACDTCHISASNFLVKSYNHVGIVGDCTTCHNGQSLGVMSKSANHFPTKQPCEFCHKNTSTFLSYQIDHIANGFVGNCFACHGGPASLAAGNSAGAVIGTFPNVMSFDPLKHFPLPTPAPDCNACHFGFSTFLGATYDHASGSTCTNCHQGQYAGVVSINTSIHIPLPSGSTCVSCHADPTGQAKPTFLGVAFHTTSLGTSPAGTCTTCHNGGFVSQNAQAIGTNHIKTAADCGTCHTGPAGTNNTAGYTTFLGAKFHQTAAGNPPTVRCDSCHDGSKLSEGAQGKIAGHVVVVAPADCVACHTQLNTSTYTTFLGASFSHVPGAYGTFPADNAGQTPKCSSCHDGTKATGKVAGHVTTSSDCNSSGCHTIATTLCPNCVNFSGVIYNHTSTASGTGYTSFGTTAPTPYTKRCDSCHNGSTLLAQPVNAGHIATAGADCVTCHTPGSTGCSNAGNCSTFLGSNFNHSTVAVGSCGTCHQGQYAGVVSLNPAIHIPQTSGNACDKCHTNAISNLLTAFPTTSPIFLNVVFHQNALGNPPTGKCSACHSGTYVSTQSKPADSMSSVISNHVATTADCVVCHTAANTSGGGYAYSSFLGAGLTHSPGTYATWPPASPASPTCASCHNGSTATGINAGHPVTAVDCIGCHTAAPTGSPASPAVLVGCPACSSFGIPAGVIHNVAPYNTVGACNTCHNGTTAVGVTAAHLPANLLVPLTCDKCHSVYDGAGSINFSTAASITAAGVPAVNGTTKYTMTHAGLTSRCDTCHNGSYIGQGVFGAVAKVATHIPVKIVSTNANTDCTSCHSTTITISSGAANWATGEKMNHNSATGMAAGPGIYCVDCHLSGGASYLGTMQKKSHNSASTKKDCSFSGCHIPTGSKGKAYTSWN